MYFCCLQNNHLKTFTCKPQKCLRLVEIEGRREGVRIELTVRQSTAQPIGFEGRDAHQSHIPPTKGGIF